MPNDQPILRIHSVKKQFPGVLALDNVSLEIFPGEVLAMVGENGAGKSTLLRILNGDYQPTEGELFYQGKQISFETPADANKLGVRVIYQEPEIVPGVTVAENIFIGELPHRNLFVNWRELFEKADAHIRDLGFENTLFSRELADGLSPAKRQLVEILRAVKSGVKVLALDEPTASLTEDDVNRLFRVVDQLRQQGVAIIYVSHRLKEIMQLADRIAVLRDGHLVAVRRPHETSEANLMQLMVGRELSAIFQHQPHIKSRVILQVSGLCTKRLKKISFDVHEGEVVGFAGLVGAGRSELAMALFGAEPILAGSIILNGQRADFKEPKDAIRAGFGFAPEDRKVESLILDLSVRENTSICILNNISRFRFVDRRVENKIVTGLATRLNIKTPSLQQEVSKLSGGNQQKVVLARWLANEPKVLILDEPTKGIDVGAKAEIYQLIDELAAQGIAVIFISSELPEVLGVSDRVLVMQDGQITGELQASEATEEAVIRLAMSQHLTKES